MNYSDAIKILRSTGRFHIDLGLDRITEVLNRLENPQNDLKYIHVAGTNGKGSVCAMLESILREAGYKTGLYTSPHIFDYTERIRVNGINIPQSEFVRLFEKIEQIPIHLTEFEILTVIMFLYFKEQNVEIVVLETGLGGRLDATNVIKENICSIITQIDLDHTDRLGNTKDEIACEKAGIIKPHCPVITSMGYEAIRDKADELDSMLILTSPYVPQDMVNSLALRGLHQIENLALVLSAINYLFKNIDELTIKRGLSKVKNPYRFEYFEDKNLIIDASHNPNGILALRNNLDYYYPNEERRFIFGCLRTKDYEKMMNILFRENDEVYLNEFDYKDACTFEELISKCPIPAKKYQRQKLNTDKLNIICGSFYMLNDLILAQN
jgi:dihydrofolate synthase/folylpolyglutamate synthase